MGANSIKSKTCIIPPVDIYPSRASKKGQTSCCCCCFRILSSLEGFITNFILMINSQQCNKVTVRLTFILNTCQNDHPRSTHKYFNPLHYAVHYKPCRRFISFCFFHTTREIVYKCYTPCTEKYA